MPTPLPPYEPPATFVLPPTKPIALVVVGCGGTGGYVAQGLARLMVEHRRRGGPNLVMMLIDGDVVEPANCGRQLFAPSEVGRNKAVALTARLSAVWGLRITAVPQMADATLLRTLSGGAPDHLKIVIGCVDNAEARRAIAESMQHWRLTIDCGNDEHTGQVAVGTTNDPLRLQGALQLGSIATELPSPYLVHPTLLHEPDIPLPDGEDCAVAVQDNRQGLNVNQLTADIAVEYVSRLVLERQLTTFLTWMDTRSLAMRSWPITPSALAEATGIPAQRFTRPRPDLLDPFGQRQPPPFTDDENEEDDDA